MSLKISFRKHFVFILVLSLLPVACSRKSTPSKDEKPKANFFWKKGSSSKERTEKNVHVVTPTAKDVPIVIKTSGKTEASERYEAKAAGDMKVLKVFVEEGGKVQAGDPLVQFDDETIKLKLNFVRAEMREAEAALANVNYLIQNKEQLLKEEKMSEVEAEGLDGRLNWYQATQERAKAEMDLYDHTGVMSQINSPIGGIVTTRNVSEGIDVTEGQELLQVVRLDPIHFVFSVSSDESAAFSNIQSLSIKFPLIPNQEFQGDVVSVGAEAKPEAGGIPIKIKINNPEFNLKGDMAGDIMVKSQVTKKAFIVPEVAIKKTDKSSYVFKIDSGKVKKAFVEIAESTPGGPVTIIKGLTDKDSVVVESDGELQDGDPVSIIADKSEEKKK